MVRGIGYVVARREHDDPDESYEWAILIEIAVCRIVSRCADRLLPHAWRRPVPAVGRADEGPRDL